MLLQKLIRIKINNFIQIVIILMSYFPISFSFFYFFGKIRKDILFSTLDSLILLSRILTFRSFDDQLYNILIAILIIFLTFKTLRKYYKSMYPLSSLQMQQICFDLNFGYKSKSAMDTNPRPKITETIWPLVIVEQDYIEIESINPLLSLETLKQNLEQVENVFNHKYKFIDVKRIAINNLIFYQFIIDRFENIKVEMPPSIPHYHLLMGKDTSGKEIYINLKENFSIWIGGKTGSGKTVTTKAFLNLIFKSVNNNIKLVIADTKGVDYQDEIDDGATYFDTSSIEGITNFNNYLIKILRQKNESKKTMASERVSHIEELRFKGIDLPLKRQIILCDEAGKYFQYEKETNKELKRLKEELTNNMSLCLSELRAFGVVIIFATQRVHMDEMNINYDNILVKLYNGIAIELSRKYCKSLVSEFATKGKWYLNSDQFCGFIKTPFIPKQKNQSCAAIVNVIVDDERASQDDNLVAVLDSEISKTKKSKLAHFFRGNNK